MKYSLDLRERVISFIEEHGSKSKAARLFKVSRQAIYDWIKFKETTGSLEASPLIRKPRKYVPEVLKQHIEQNPDGLP